MIAGILCSFKHMFRHASATPGFALLQRRHPDRPQQVEQGGRQHRAD
jgi:hypothetical protein